MKVDPSSPSSPPVYKRPEPLGWLMGAVLCSLLAILPGSFVVEQCMHFNEFTVMIVFIPVLIAAALLLAAVCFVIGYFNKRHQLRKYEQFEEQTKNQLAKSSEGKT